MTRPAPSQAAVTRAVRAVTAAGLPVGSVEIGADGSIRVVIAPQEVDDYAAQPIDLVTWGKK